MGKRDLAMVACAAAATMTITLAVFWSFGAVADAPQPEAPTIQWPKLTNAEYEITLRTSKPSYGADEAPVVELDVANKTCNPVTVSAKLRMMVRPQPAAISRMEVIASPDWETSRTVTVDSMRTTTVSVPTEKKVANGGEVFFTLTVGTESVNTQPYVVKAADGAARPSVRVLQQETK